VARGFLRSDKKHTKGGGGMSGTRGYIESDSGVVVVVVVVEV